MEEEEERCGRMVVNEQRRTQKFVVEEERMASRLHLGEGATR